jgi:hypothetical protein
LKRESLLKDQWFLAVEELVGEWRMASAYTQENSWEGLDIVTNKNIANNYIQHKHLPLFNLSLHSFATATSQVQQLMFFHTIKGQSSRK